MARICILCVARILRILMVTYNLKHMWSIRQKILYLLYHWAYYAENYASMPVVSQNFTMAIKSKFYLMSFLKHHSSNPPIGRPKIKTKTTGFPNYFEETLYLLRSSKGRRQ